jgi:NAD(P)H-dependent FMN reductase
VRLLIVHHTTSPSLHTLFEAVMDGARQVEGIEVVAKPALSATAVDVLEADGYVLGAPVNLGMIAGALKHFFDQIYYPCLEATVRRPFGVYLHGNDDTTGAVRDITKIVAGLQWTQVHEHVLALGPPAKADIDSAWDLGATVAARLTAVDR